MNGTEISLLQKRYDEILNEEIELKKLSNITTFEINCEPSFLKNNKEGIFINGKIQVGRRKIDFTLGKDIGKSYFNDYDTVVFILRNGAFCCCAKKSEFDSMNEALQKSFKLKKERIEISQKIHEHLFPKEHIKIINVDNDNVLIEYTDLSSEKVSFSKAKNIIKDCIQQSIIYTYTNTKKSIDFINKIPKRIPISNGIDNINYLVLKS